MEGRNINMINNLQKDNTILTALAANNNPMFNEYDEVMN